MIKKERKKILNARKPDKELQAYFSDPELGLIEVKSVQIFEQAIKEQTLILLSIIIQNNNVCAVTSNVLGQGLMVKILILIYLSS